jgi:GT2 family glycosyltransferase
MIKITKKMTKKLLADIPLVKSLLRIRRSLIEHNDQEYEKLVKYLYFYILKRTPTNQEIRYQLTSVNSPSNLFETFVNSVEYSQIEADNNAKRKEFIKGLYRNLYYREPSENEIEIHYSSGQDCTTLLETFVNSKEYQMISEQSIADKQSIVDLRSYIGGSAYLLGESNSINLAILLRWYREASEEVLVRLNQIRFDRSNLNILNQSPSQIREDYWVTIITSLYKGEKYIQAFLENITAQTIFDKCQLFIVDANSPQDEYKVINNYINIFPNNITYQRLDKTIGIYEAWNLAINNSSSEFITNANVDDLHRSDALELKVAALRNNPKIDVVYSDVYYSFLENSPFDVIEKCGLRTNLPTANKFNLLMFNSPHNSPLWRRSLHDKIGLFDPTYQSAGDMELWLRAAFSDCLFMKIEEPVVAYYHNPNGLSTRPGSLGSPEGGKVIEIYRNLISKK